MAVVATGFAVRRTALDAGIERLERMGFRVRRGRHLRARDGYLAGTDDQRLDDLLAAWLDPDVRAIWFARGGYGTARLLGRIPWRRVRPASKVLIGYSDVTALMAPALDRTASRPVYGPVVVELARADAWHAASLRATLRGEVPRVRFRAGQVVHPGRATGRLVGGNLSVLAHLLGTRWFPRLDGAIVVLEDVGEETYRIDRLLTHLVQSGRLDRAAGVAVGRFDPPRRTTFPPDRPLLDVLRDRLGGLGIPVVRDLPFGHVARKRSIPLGAVAEIDTGARRFGPVAR